MNGFSNCTVSNKHVIIAACHRWSSPILQPHAHNLRRRMCAKHDRIKCMYVYIRIYIHTYVHMYVHRNESPSAYSVCFIFIQIVMLSSDTTSSMPFQLSSSSRIIGPSSGELTGASSSSSSSSQPSDSRSDAKKCSSLSSTSVRDWKGKSFHNMEQKVGGLPLSSNDAAMKKEYVTQ